MKNTIADLAYAAGLFDGEGCIYLQRKKTYFYLTINLSSTSLILLQWWTEKFKGIGTIYNVTTPSRSPRWRPSYRWFAHTRQAAQVLQLIEPFLIQKQQEAKVALQFQERRSFSNNRKQGLELRREQDKENYLLLQTLKKGNE